MRYQFHLTALLVKTTSLLQVLCWKSYHGNKEDLAHHYRVCIMEPFTLLFGEVITLFLFSFSESFFFFFPFLSFVYVFVLK